MNAYVNIRNELRSLFASNSILKLLVPLDIIIMFAALVLILLDIVFRVNLGSFISAFAYWAFILGLLLTYANTKEQPLYIGLFGYALIQFINVLIALFGSLHYISWASLIKTAIFAGFGYIVLKRTLAGTSTDTSING